MLYDPEGGIPDSGCGIRGGIPCVGFIMGEYFYNSQYLELDIACYVYVSYSTRALLPFISDIVGFCMSLQRSRDTSTSYVISNRLEILVALFCNVVRNLLPRQN